MGIFRDIKLVLLATTQFTMRLVFATHNLNKLKEVRQLVGPDIELLSLGDIGCDEEIVEDGSTLEENAAIKANHVYRNYGYSCFADDTGLFVDCLDGAPGVHSARYAGPMQNSSDNLSKLLLEMEKYDHRSAHFKTVIALNLEGELHLFSGMIQGSITPDIKGTEGFGYDPVFLPNGHEQTFAEMPLSQKNSISHRALAFKKLADFLSK